VGSNPGGSAPAERIVLTKHWKDGTVTDPTSTDPALTVGSPRLDVSDLGVVLAQMGGVLLSAETVDTAVNLVTRLAAAAIPGSAGAGVTLVDSRGSRTTGASDAMVEEADALQYDLDAGPCLTAWRDRVTVRVDDVEHETRWPQWTAAVADQGVASVLSVPLLAGADCLGAIKVYAREPAAYDAHAEALLSLFAQQAAILLANTQTVANARQLAGQLTEALVTRDLIGQAKGILMAQGAADDHAAFGMLVEASQRSNVKLHEVARRVVASVSGQPADRRSG
jgi:GAF domain-containing protein